jgi:hypothetical protein
MTYLTSSNTERQNILNNRFVVEPLQEWLGLNFPIVAWEMRMTIEQVADFFEVNKRTIERYLQDHEDELKKNGYEVFTWKRLQEAKKALGTDINVGSKTTVLWLFNFRSFLNLWMLLTQSDKAKELRGIILDVLIDVMNQKTWWKTKYINQRDENFIATYVDSISYREEFTEALHHYVDAWAFKFPLMTNKVYHYLFGENSVEYKKLLKLWAKENLRGTLYDEVLTAISTIEIGFAHELKKKYESQWNKKVSYNEAEDLFDEFVENPVLKPLVEKSRKVMSSRDKWLRDIVHEALKPYLESLTPEEYEKFLSEDWKRTEEKTTEALTIIDDNKDVFIRLKDR